MFLGHPEHRLFFLDFEVSFWYVVWNETGGVFGLLRVMS